MLTPEHLLQIKNVYVFSCNLDYQNKIARKKEVVRLPSIQCLFENFSKSCCLTDSVAQVVEFCSSDFTVTNDVDMVDLRRMKRERSFYADFERYLSNGEGLSNASVLLSDNYAFECLESFSRSFNDFYKNLDGIADFDFWQVGTLVFIFDYIDYVAH